MTMQIRYGGGFNHQSLDILGRTAVVFTVHQVLDYSMTPLMSQDNTDREVVHIRLRVGFQLGTANGMTDVDDGTGSPTARAQNAATLFARLSTISDILSTPRLPLQIFVNGNLWIEVPQNVAGSQGLAIGSGPTYAVDCRNGPLPSRPTFTRWSGTKNCYGTWEIETFIQKPAGYNNAPNSDQPIILSHRWREESVISEDHLTTRTITGRAVFANNVLLRQGYAADDFRSFLLRDVPDGYQRSTVRSAITSDGCSCDYVLVDKSTTENLGFSSEILSFDARIRKGFQTERGLFSIPLFHAELDITLRGHPNTSRQTLYQAALSAIMSFGFTQQAADRFAFFARNPQLLLGFGGAQIAPIKLNPNVINLGTAPGYKFNINVNMNQREVAASAGFSTGGDMMSSLNNWPAELGGAGNGQVSGLAFTETLPPITAFIPNQILRGALRNPGLANLPQRYADNPAPRYANAFSDIYSGRMLVQMPNDTTSAGNIGAPPPRSAPLGLAGGNGVSPSLNPLAAAVERAP
jgi:hypothetical protein